MGLVTTNQVARSHASGSSFRASHAQALDNIPVSSRQLMGAMTIRPGGPTGGRRSMEASVQQRVNSQDRMAATGSKPSWLGMSHDLRAQQAKEVLLQVCL